MAEKPDYYEVLGVTKTATKAEIKTAFQRIAMKNHPDMVKNKANLTEAQKAAAVEKFKMATEAEKVLTDDTKRDAYDRFGHKGVENLEAGKSAASGQSYEQVAGPVRRREYSTEDTFDFFEKRSEQRKRHGDEAVDDGLSASERRERARQERLRRRQGGGETSATPANTGSAANAFHDVAEKVNEAAQKLGEASVPLETLEKFRENLADFLSEVDKAISRAKRGPGAKFQS